MNFGINIVLIFSVITLESSPLGRWDQVNMCLWEHLLVFTEKQLDIDIL